MTCWEDVGAAAGIARDAAVAKSPAGHPPPGPGDLAGSRACKLVQAQISAVCACRNPQITQELGDFLDMARLRIKLRKRVVEPKVRPCDV